VIDFLSKSTGYEGPTHNGKNGHGKWVEVQIRSGKDARDCRKRLSGHFIIQTRNQKEQGKLKNG